MHVNPWQLGKITLVLLFLVVNLTYAENKSKEIFSKTSHDFGTVARGSKAIYEFEFQNPYDRQLVVDHVRSSCGCTKASIKNQIIAADSKGKVIAEFNTRSFLGKKSATITVVIRQPVRTEIQLRVTGNIRGDIVFEPGEVEFQNILQGESKSQSTIIHYAGSDAWEVVDVQSWNKYLAADLEELHRGNGTVKYKMTITMQGDFPEGHIRDYITIVTNDRKQKKIPISFSARVSSPLSVSPKSVDLSPQKPGSRRLIFKSSKSFQFKKVNCDDPRVKVSFDQKIRKTQLVTVKYNPIDGMPASKSIPIAFETDLGKKFSKTVNLDFE